MLIFRTKKNKNEFITANYNTEQKKRNTQRLY